MAISAHINIGDRAFDFALPDQEGKMHKLSDHAGFWVLLYFYPKDDTPGCTKEACGIRDNFSDFEKLNIAVLGVSRDSVKTHQKFAQKYGLPFTLLADEQKEVINKYGVSSRTSFLIDPEGKIAKIYENVKPEIHASQVLEDIKMKKVGFVN